MANTIIAKDYYAILGLMRDATDEDIKRAYKKMALKYHPDKNPENPKDAEEKFKEIGEAYYVLSDKERKLQYDTFSGTSGMFFDFGYEKDSDPFKIFEVFFKKRNPFEDEDFGFNNGFINFNNAFKNDFGALWGGVEIESKKVQIINGQKTSKTIRTVQDPLGLIVTTVKEEDDKGKVKEYLLDEKGSVNRDVEEEEQPKTNKRKK